MDFTFDEHSFLVKAGQKIRIDISSSAFPHYVRHTNRKGLFSDQTTATYADNTVVLHDSTVTIPVLTRLNAYESK
jgi:predicted acyl esterase